ncbi:hypothetical protein SCHPADRAFT_412148 [Schizopora paradoxa]|uniref:Uncharacterized protein n=1 Tax=Schizopora paradoxa TaxID=27342 RepID=A0A0H2RL30_9AGAM|nr:hypothetical protein SCHPADRAFT_412148 [Schizopora paradoxa]
MHQHLFKLHFYRFSTGGGYLSKHARASRQARAVQALPRRKTKISCASTCPFSAISFNNFCPHRLLVFQPTIGSSVAIQSIIIRSAGRRRSSEAPGSGSRIRLLNELMVPLQSSLSTGEGEMIRNRDVTMPDNSARLSFQLSIEFISREGISRRRARGRTYRTESPVRLSAPFLHALKVAAVAAGYNNL